MAPPAWLQAAGKVVKRAYSRHLVFEDPSILTRLECTVDAAACAPPPTPSLPSITPTQANDADCTNFLDPDLELPRTRSSPEAAATLLQAFAVLRDSCTACRRNQDALRQTSLADTGRPGPAFSLTLDTRTDATSPFGVFPVLQRLRQALKFALGKAQLACEGSQQSTGVRLAVQTAIQFVCNFCVGNEDNQALVWRAWFPRGLMELTNGVKTDRRLLSLVVALIHNCCLPPRGSGALKGMVKNEVKVEACPVWRGGQERLRRLTADKAFCCLLMKVVPHHHPKEVQAGPVPWDSCSATSSFSTTASPGRTAERTQDGDSSSSRGEGEEEDPAAEWLYLLFCRFVQEGLSRRVYDNVGIPFDRRSTVPADHFRPDSRDAADERLPRQATEEEEVGEMDLFFPVTPEQLVLLNLAELAAGDEVVTGGERRASTEQKQARKHLIAWLSGLLAEMPLNQRLRPSNQYCREPPPREAANHPGLPQVASEDAELARRRMREEARSAVLRALAALLADCDEETRRGAAGSAFSAAPVSRVTETDLRGTGETESAPSTRRGDGLVPLCMSLLSACGGAAEPEKRLGGEVLRTSRVTSRMEGGCEAEGGGAERTALAPAGRRVELMKVIGNACFRCQKAQDLARELGGLPLVLNHCALDGENPLLREYALLAVRNLCEGHAANQAAISALTPQGCAPGVEEELAAVGLNGRLDDQGRLRVEPRASSDV